MKAMVDPRMVAASTQDLAFCAHGTVAAVDCATASSQGVLILAMSVLHSVSGAQDYEPMPRIDWNAYRHVKTIKMQSMRGGRESAADVFC
jgi:hypothetical protein